MIKVTTKALAHLCHVYQISEEDLSFLGGGREDSDGIAYSYTTNGHKMVLKILAFETTGGAELQTVNERLDFVHFLGTQGIDIAFPEENAYHKLYATFEDENHIFLAYTMKFCEGGTPATDQLATDFSYHWGKLIGKAHKATKSYPVWKNFSTNSSEYGYMDEISFFTNWCKDEFVKSKWQEMNSTLAKLPIDRNNYGFIHNDNHQHNIIVKDKHITMIDFDVAACQFFLQDIITPVQGILFDLSGGMYNTVYNKEPLKQYFEHFINGYESEYHIDDFWLKQIDTFINYRRLLLFTCMQGYINQNPELKKGFYSMIEEPPAIFLS